MPGYQEILIISAVVVAVIIIPRMMEPKKPTLQLVRPRKKLAGRWRLSIAISLLYPFIMAGVMQPWRRNAVVYLYIGLGPVLLGWLGCWVLRGFRRK